MDLNPADLGMGGIGILCLEINSKNYFIGWADSNNMENGLREEVVANFAKDGKNLLEICTSDTHYTTGARNRNGYYQFGKISESKQISQWYSEIADQAIKTKTSATFETIKNISEVRVMGSKIFKDYSKAMDKALKITKVFLIGGLALFFTSVFFSPTPILT